jgi:hypothetical protein
MNGNYFWGPAVWKTIHSFAVSYTPDQREQFRFFINNLTNILPCEMCRKHLRDNLRALPIDNYLSDHNRLFLWTYLLHDRVNQQLGKKSPPYEQVKKIYFQHMGTTCTDCKA